jgi:hypothetical protein
MLFDFSVNGFKKLSLKKFCRYHKKSPVNRLWLLTGLDNSGRNALV